MDLHCSHSTARWCVYPIIIIIFFIIIIIIIIIIIASSTVFNWAFPFYNCRLVHFDSCVKCSMCNFSSSKSTVSFGVEPNALKMWLKHKL